MFFTHFSVYDSGTNKRFEKFCTGMINCVETSTLIATSKDALFYKLIEKDHLIYFAVDKKLDEVMGYVAFNKLKQWKAIETHMLYICTAHRRKGVALALYDAILKDGQIVVCGVHHNPKSRALWAKIVSNPSYTTWAQDIIDPSSEAVGILVNEEGRLECELKIYEDIKKLRRRRTQDVRILAIHPRYA